MRATLSTPLLPSPATLSTPLLPSPAPCDRSGSNSFPRTNKRSSWVSSPAAEVESSSRSRSSLRAVRWAFRWIGAERQSDRTEGASRHARASTRTHARM
eukprot:1822839-Pleurochrysis_carterae.AAC.4